MKTVRIAVIGCGMIANTYHLPALAREKQATLVWACDLIEDRAVKAKEKFGFEKYTLDYKDILKDPNTDAVCIFTKIEMHAKLAIECAEAKKKIFMQKPFAYSIEEGRKIIKAIRENGVDFTPSFMHSYLPESIEAQKIIQQGLIGKIESVLMRNTLSNPYDTAPSYGGAMMDIGCHGIDLIRTMTQKQYVSVYVASVYPRPVNQNDTIDDSTPLNGDERRMTLVYHMTDDVTAIHEVNWSKTAKGTRCEMEIHGDKGTIYLMNPHDSAGVMVAANPIPNSREEMVSVKINVPNIFYGETHHRLLVNDWMNGTTNSKKPEDGFSTLAVVQAARKSIISGKVEQVAIP